jgi:hypothetical protein
MPMGSTASGYLSWCCDMCDCTTTGSNQELAKEGWKVHGDKARPVTLCGDCETIMATRRELRKKLSEPLPPLPDEQPESD